MRKFLLLPLLLWVGATQVSAASAPKLTMTDPEANSVVNAPVYMVHLMFDLPVDARNVVFNVTDAAGKAVNVGQPMPMGSEGTMLMAIPDKPLPAGTYKVKWRAAGPDGKPLEGEFSFTAK